MRQQWLVLAILVAALVALLSALGLVLAALAQEGHLFG